MKKKKQLFEEFITQNLDNAYRFAFTHAKCREDAEDIVAESVVRALKAVDRLKNDGCMKPWFYRIIVNTALTHKKSNSKFMQTDFSESETLLPPHEDDYSDLTLRDLISSLDDDLRGIVVLKICEDMTFDEIASVTALSCGTVKTRFYRALKILRHELGGDLK